MTANALFMLLAVLAAGSLALALRAARTRSDLQGVRIRKAQTRRKHPLARR